MKTEEIMKYDAERLANQASKKKPAPTADEIADLKAENSWLRNIVIAVVGEKAAAVLFGEEDV